MRARLSGYSGTLRRLWQALVLFAIARIAIGVALIVFAGRDDAAWSLRVTIIASIAVLVCFGAAMAVRLWSPPRNPS